MASQIKDAGFELSHYDKMALAVRDLLAASEKLDAWTDGRIHRQDLFAPDLSTVAPFILVGPLGTEPEVAVGCVKVEVEIGIVIGWEIFPPVIEDDEPTISAVIDEIRQILLRAPNSLLPYEGRPLVRRWVRFRTLDFGGGTTETNTVKMIRVDSATYEVHYSNEWRPD